MIDTHYRAADLEKVDAEYSELDNIPETVVSLRARLGWVQGTGDESSASTSH